MISDFMKKWAKQKKKKKRKDTGEMLTIEAEIRVTQLSSSIADTHQMLEQVLILL